jgi:hypothetical protein
MGGAALWVAGNLVWIFSGVGDAVPVWMGFLLLTILGERLELSRIAPQSPVGLGLFAASTVLVFAGMVAGTGLLAAGMTGFAIWIAVFDLARRTVRRPGQPRYVAITLFGAAAWLAISGALLIGASGALARDAMLHAFFLGFVVSMVFAHAPIIAPALSIPLRWSAWLYLPVALLHVTLALRVAGDLIESRPLQLAGSLGNALVFLAFALTAIASSVRPARNPLAIRKVG